MFPPYAELHCKSNFSFLQAASHPAELVQRASELQYAALAITDQNSLAGAVRSHVAAKEANLKLLIGAEIVLRDGPPLVMWATDRAAYGRLSRLLTVGRRRAEKGACELTFEDLAEHAEGLLAGVLLKSDFASSPLAQSESAKESRPSLRLYQPGGAASFPQFRVTAAEWIRRYRDLFGDRCYALAELHCGPDDRRLLVKMLSAAQAAEVPAVAAGDVHFHHPSRRMLQDVLTAVRGKCTVAEAGHLLFPNAQRHLKSREQRARTFAEHPSLLARTLEIAQRCSFSMDELRYEYPEELCPAGTTPMEYLKHLAWKGARRRYPEGIPQKVGQLLEHELELIEDLHYEAYFLTVWDLVRFARGRNILCQGRGSAANSAVCFCLGVTSVDPDRIDVLFERFISRERNEAPDIDVDFEHERREEVLQYVYEKYGRERAGMTAEVICYRPRSAMRDVAKALGLSLDRVDAMAKAIDFYGTEPETISMQLREAGVDPQAATIRQVIELVGELMTFPRHLSQHVGGMVMTQGPLCELVPIENAAMAGRTVIQWNKDDLDSLGVLKVDCLSLGMLSAIHKCFDLVEQQTGRALTLASVPPEDPAVYDMICRADTIGVFQIESRAQMSMLPRLKPRCFYDLVIEVAIVRPGPIQGNMVHPYLRRRDGLESVEYPNEAIRQVLVKTLGVPIFQEQAMRLAVVAAGFSPGEADQLRRAMGSWGKTGAIVPFREKLLRGMRAQGLSEKFAEQVWEQIKGFGNYGFPESHSASFALLVYVSAWLKRYFPAAFCASIINSQPMGFYAPAQLIRDAREHGVQVLPVDVNASGWDCSLEQAPRETNRRRQNGNLSGPAVRLGMRLIRGLREAHARAIEAAREEGPFVSQHDLLQRTGLPRRTLVRLAEADAFRSLGTGRREALWQAYGQEKELPLFAGVPSEEAKPSLPAMAPGEEVREDYRMWGLSLRAHPMSFFREELKARKIIPCGRLRVVADGEYVRVCGLVLLRQRPSTARGITFVTLEDETGLANLVVRPDVWQKFRHVARTAKVLLAHGRLERKGQICHLQTYKLEDLPGLVRGLRSPSRDFR